MPRPNSVYMIPQPVEVLNLEEVRFWLRIMQEHSVFIRNGLPCDQTELISDAQGFYDAFHALYCRAEKSLNDKKFRELVAEATALVATFRDFKRHLLELMLTCQLGGSNFPLFLDHMAREAEYFLQLLNKIGEGKTALREAAIPLENAFWLRIMAEHAAFIVHLLDPSERRLIAEADRYVEEFDQLLLQGWDFVSMLNNNVGDVRSFWRFLCDVRRSVAELRDFQKMAEELIEKCRLVSIIPELLADHMRREADHFLMILSLMEKRVMHDVALVDEDDDYEEEVWVKPAMKESPKLETPDYEEDDFEPEDEVPPPVIEHIVAAAKPPKPLKEPKYKWEMRPRPLGKK